MTCPFHAKSSRTKCKKYSALKGPSQQERLRALKRLHIWCIAWSDFNRQRLHVGLSLVSDVDAAYPGEAFIRARGQEILRQYTQQPPKTDEELDAEARGAAPAAAKAPARRAHAPKSKAKASLLKAKAKPKAGAAQQRSSSDSSTSGSSSSSSSTTSTSSQTD